MGMHRKALHVLAGSSGRAGLEGVGGRAGSGIYVSILTPDVGCWGSLHWEGKLTSGGYITVQRHDGN